MDAKFNKIKYRISLYGGVAQLGEHLPCKQGVKGSNPFISTQDNILKCTLKTAYRTKYSSKYDFNRNYTARYEATSSVLFLFTKKEQNNVFIKKIL